MGRNQMTWKTFRDYIESEIKQQGISEDIEIAWMG
jgi:hypothetical protein